MTMKKEEIKAKIIFRKMQMQHKILKLTRCSKRTSKRKFMAINTYTYIKKNEKFQTT